MKTLGGSFPITSHKRKVNGVEWNDFSTQTRQSNYMKNRCKNNLSAIYIMPYRLRHLRTKKRCYQVVNTQNDRTFSKCSTKKNAEKQMRLLRAIQYNKSFKPRNVQLANSTRRRLRRK